MLQRNNKPPAPWLLIILFAGITICVIAGGSLYYFQRKQTLLNIKQIELTAISNLKIRQVSKWRLDILSDAQFLTENSILSREFSKYLKHRNETSLKVEILQILKSLTSNFDYKNALLIDTGSNVVLAYPEKDTLIGEHLIPMVPEAIRKREVILTDLHRAKPINFVHLDLLVPIFEHHVKGDRVIGVFALRVDPSKYLFPLLDSWPVPSRTAETYIVSKSEKEAFYLSELKNIKDGQLSLKIPFSGGNLPETLALEDITQTSDAIDYKGEHVVAAMNKIPGTQWYLVAKVDRSEVLETFNTQMRLVVLILTLFLLAVGLFLLAVVRSQKTRFYRSRFESELEKLALVRHYDYILKYANDIILLIDSDLNVVEANDKALLTYQYSREELIGMNIVSIRAPEKISQMADDLVMIDMNESGTFETIHRRKDNSIFPVEISSRVVIIEGVKYYQSIGRDITERKKAEESLRESEDKFRKIFDESPFPMAMTGKDLIITRTNSAFEKMTGYSEDELKSFTFRSFTHPEHIEEDAVAMMRLISGELSVYKKEKRYLCNNGSVIWGSTTVTVIRNRRGEIHNFLVMVEDITKRKKAESELIAAKEKAEENDRLKTAFLHNVSHEIRTPLNGIIGFSTLLCESDQNDEERKLYSDMIFQGSNQLVSIINDIVDIASIESGQVKINIVESNINQILKTLYEQFIVGNLPTKVKMAAFVGLPDDESVIMTDKVKLIQILSNLISNAIKFTSQGTIEFGYMLKGKDIEFWVKDSGIGIPAEHVEKIFERFYQVDGSVSRKYGGTGLGLSICKAYVELLGGDIGVKSDPGKGTTFTITLPYRRALQKEYQSHKN